MTRYNNLGIKKRKYVEATQFGGEGEGAPEPGPSRAPSPPAQSDPPADGQPQKKKRKRGKPRKALPEGAEGADAAGAEGAEGADAAGAEGAEVGKSKPVTKAEKGKKKLREKRGADARKFAAERSERRRLKRQDERSMNTTCYACREQGHAARHCPKAIASDALEGGKKKLGKQVVGICYRCGSRKHSLARCPAPQDSENPLPFASCFVCSGKGHLASSCPQNQSKGVYPNGGCCKLCGETTHLAKNCALRKPETISTNLFVGTGTEAGADEDDFHTFKRKTAEVSKDEKADERRKKSIGMRVGALSGAVKSFGAAPLAPKKVVTF